LKKWNNVNNGWPGLAIIHVKIAGYKWLLCEGELKIVSTVAIPSGVPQALLLDQHPAAGIPLCFWVAQSFQRIMTG
jgi:hypothetical protein